MNPLAREQLRGMIQQYGPDVCNTRSSCAMFIKSQCGQCPKEAGWFVTALELGVVQELRKLPQVDDWEAAIAPLCTTLVTHGLSAEESRWVVESWANALNKGPGAAPEQPAPQHSWERKAAPRRRSGDKLAQLLELADNKQILITVYVLGAICLLMGVYGVFIGADLKDQGREAIGNVISVIPLFDEEDDDERKWEIVVDYRAGPESAQYTTITRDRYNVGQQIAITYMPGNPSATRLGKPDSLHMFGIMLIVLGALLLGLGGGVTMLAKSKEQ